MANYRNRAEEVSSKKEKLHIADEQAHLAASLGSHQYTGRAGDYRTESERFVGWNYLGITAVCKMAARASVEIYDDREDDAKNRTQRASLRLAHGTEWKSFAQDDEKQLADAKFRWWKLIEQPSPWQTGRQMRWDVVQQMHLHGTAMVWNVRNGFGKTLWRIPIPMNLVTPLTPGQRDDMPFGGIKVHSLQWLSTYFPNSSLKSSHFHYVANREISLDDLTIYAYPHPLLRGDGYSPTSAGEGWLGLVQLTEDAQAQQYADGPQQKVLVQPLEEDVSTNKDLDSFQRRMDRRLKSSETGFVAIPNGGATPISFAPDSMGYTQTSESMSAAIMALHGTPKTATGMVDGMTYGSIAASMQGFTSISVQSDLDLIADEDTATMRKEEGSAFSIEYTAPVYNDPDLKERQLSADMQAGTITCGEWRKERGRKPFGDERDDMMAGSQGLKEFGNDQGGGMPGMDMGGGMPGMDMGMPGMDMGMPGMEEPSMEAPPESGINEMIGGPSPMDEPVQWEGSDQVLPTQTKSLLGNPVTPIVAAVDLDSVLSVPCEGDEIGDPVPVGRDVVGTLRDGGVKIVIYSYRDDEDEVAWWLEKNGIEYDSINDSEWGGESIILSDPVGEDYEREVLGAIKAIPSDSVKKSIRKAMLQRVNAVSVPEVDRGEVHVRLGGELAKELIEIQDQIDNEDVVSRVPESELRITVSDGITGVNPDRVAVGLNGVNRFPFATSSALRVKTRKGKPCLLYLPIEGEGVSKASGVVESELPIVDTDSPEEPHVVLAEINPEAHEKYEGKSVRQLSSEAKSLVYQHPGQKTLRIPLR